MTMSYVKLITITTIIIFASLQVLAGKKDSTKKDITKQKERNSGHGLAAGAVQHLPIVPPGAGKNGDKYLTAVDHFILSPGWQKISKNNPQENGSIDIGNIKKGVYYLAVDMDALKNIPNEKMKELNYGKILKGMEFDSKTTKLQISFIENKNQVRCVYGNCVYAWVFPKIDGIRYSVSEKDGTVVCVEDFDAMPLIKITVEKDTRMKPLYFHAVNNYGIDKTGTMRTVPLKEEIDKFLKGEEVLEKIKEKQER
ncbi:MAG: hypothetical protein V1779_05705 [bacterium]